MFQQLGGLPLRPLAVHAVVVLVPLSAFGAVTMAVRPSWARAYGQLVAAGAVLASLAALVAQQAGNALLILQGHVPGSPGPLDAHARWGLATVISVAVFALLTVASTLLSRRGGPVPAARVLAVAAAVAGAVGTAFTLLAGHSGASSSVAGLRVHLRRIHLRCTEYRRAPRCSHQPCEQPSTTPTAAPTSCRSETSPTR